MGNENSTEAEPGGQRSTTMSQLIMVELVGIKLYMHTTYTVQDITDHTIKTVFESAIEYCNQFQNV